MANDVKKKAAYQISVWPMAEILIYAKRYTVETYVFQNQSIWLAQIQRQLQ